MPDFSYREFTIKKRNGKTRRICAPSKDLLAEQRRLLPGYVRLFTFLERALFNEEIFHGFVPGCNCVTAAIKHQGYQHTIGLDISNCFDSINISDITNNLVGTINLEPQIVAHQDGSLAQGFATSPILANIYLLNPVKELHDFLTQFIGVDKFMLTVYADDLQISLKDTTSYFIMNTVIDMATALFSKYALTINKKKTRIHHAKFGNRRILGIQVGDNTISPNRRLRKKIRAARFQGNGPSLGGLTTTSRLLLPKSRR